MNRDSPSEELRLLRAALDVSRFVEPGPIAQAIVHGACSLTEAPGGFLYLSPPDGGVEHLLGCHVANEDPRRKGLLRVPLAEVLKGAGFAATDAMGPCPGLFAPFEFEGMMSIPFEEVNCRGRLLLGWSSAQADERARAALECAVRFLAECSPALANGMKMDRIRELVIKDDQTESYNRRHMDRFLLDEIERARRYGTTLSVIFLDLDNLKEVNSQYGHAAGSLALRELSTRVITMIRGSDKVFRYGGDEFCVVLPETDVEGALELAERLRVTIASRPFSVEPGAEVSLSASFGVASFPLHGESAVAILSSADRAMAQVKKSGKNSIGVGGDGLKTASGG